VPQLGKQASEIAEDPSLGNLAILNPIEGRAGVADFSPRGRHAENLSAMRSGVSEPREDAIPFGDHLVDLVAKIRKRALHSPHIIAKRRAPMRFGTERSAERNLFGQQFVDESEVPFVPHLVVISRYQIFVCLLGHGALGFCLTAVLSVAV
jgi:hypothetical protein